MVDLTDQDLEYLMEHGDFSPSIRQAAERVVVIMTQSWCSQWQDMQRYLPDFDSQAAIYAIEYDLHPWFDRIMVYKEDILENREVPYLRYYWQGNLIVACNWLPKNTFGALLKRNQAFIV